MHALCSAVRNAMFVPWISSSSSRLSQIFFLAFIFFRHMFGFLFGLFSFLTRFHFFWQRGSGGWVIVSSLNGDETSSFILLHLTRES